MTWTLYALSRDSWVIDACGVRHTELTCRPRRDRQWRSIRRNGGRRGAPRCNGGQRRAGALGDGIDVTGIDQARIAIDRDHVAFVEMPRAEHALPGRAVQMEVSATDHGDLAELTGDDRGVRRPPAEGGQDPGRR